MKQKKLEGSAGMRCNNLSKDDAENDTVLNELLQRITLSGSIKFILNAPLVLSIIVDLSPRNWLAEINRLFRACRSMLRVLLLNLA